MKPELRRAEVNSCGRASVGSFFRRFARTAILFVIACTPSVLCEAQQSPANGARLAAAMEEMVVASVAKTEKSVVAIAQVAKDETAAAYQVPNMGRLGFGSRHDDSLPTDADFVPGRFAAGVVVDQSGLIVTTYHALGNIKESVYYVWSQHKPFRAQVIAADGWFDLAVLKVEKADLKPITMGDAKSVRKGQFVIALGNPYAVGRDGEASAAWGIVSNLSRRAPRVPERSNEQTGRETLHHYGTLIQTDTKLNLGFGGGALVNLQGEMIGLTTAYASGPMAAEAAGFAIPVNEYFQQALDKLKAGKSPEFGFLGVAQQPLEAKLRQRGHHGALVETVFSETPAARAGIQPGDVITEADGQPLHDDDDLIRVVGSLPPERLIRLTVFRGDLLSGQGEVFEKEVKLAKKYIHTRRPAFATVPPPSWRGMQVDYSSAAYREPSVQIPPNGRIYVAEVVQDSPAWHAGIRRGMFILRVADNEVSTPRDFFAAVESRTGEVPIQLISTGGSATVQTVSP